MKIRDTNRTKFSNPTTANPGMGNPMTPSPTSEPLKGGVNHGDSPQTTTRDTDSLTGQGTSPNHLKDMETDEERKDRSAA